MKFFTAVQEVSDTYETAMIEYDERRGAQETPLFHTSEDPLRCVPSVRPESYPTNADDWCKTALDRSRQTFPVFA